MSWIGTSAANVGGNDRTRERVQWLGMLSSSSVCVEVHAEVVLLYEASVITVTYSTVLLSYVYKTKSFRRRC